MQLREFVHMLLHTQVPFGTRANDFDHVPGNPEQQKRPGDQVCLTDEVITPVNIPLVCWQAGLICNVAIPQATVVC